jgi:hypothetical protein
MHAEGAKLVKQDDGSVLAEGSAPQTDVYTLTATTTLTGITGLRLEAMTDDSLPRKGPGRGQGGNFVISELRVTATPTSGDAEPVDVKLSNASADFSQDRYTVDTAIDGNAAKLGWAVAPQIGKPHTAMFETDGKVGFENGTHLRFVLEQNFKQHSLGRFRLSITTSKPPLNGEAPKLPDAVAAVLAKEPAERTRHEVAVLVKHYASLDAEYRTLKKAVDDDSAGLGSARLRGAQDLTWALINSPAFLFNR